MKDAEYIVRLEKQAAAKDEQIQALLKVIESLVLAQFRTVGNPVHGGPAE